MVNSLQGADLPGTRAEALTCLNEFLPVAEEYAASRNYVVPGHGNVSRLSPAMRCRLLCEAELVAAVRDQRLPESVEKFEQEVWWRLYWKGWLEQRPAIWEQYRRESADLKWTDRARQVAAGESGVEIMDYFARELTSTGYLHNHARMWWAAYWIHVERLPWVLGADFFLQYLLDGDAATNTLSWRWVAGLQTEGKDYLVRRSNLEKFVHADILDAHRGGLERLEAVSSAGNPFVAPPPAKPIEGGALPSALPDRYGLWLHDEDLFLEESPLANTIPISIAGFLPHGIWREEGYSPQKTEFLERAMRDGSVRAGNHFGRISVFESADVLEDELLHWAQEHDLKAVLAMRPFVGVLADRMDGLRRNLATKGIELILVRRSEEVPIFNKATAGFFGFWKKTARFRG